MYAKSALLILSVIVAGAATQSFAQSAPTTPDDQAAHREARLEKRFDRMDTNHDGMISKEEFMAAHQGDGQRHHGHHKTNPNAAQTGASGASASQ